MKEILIAVAVGLPVNDDEIIDALTDVCIETNSECNYSCPVFSVNSGSVPQDAEGRCKCFCNGEAMLSFIRENTVGYVPDRKTGKKRQPTSKDDIIRFTSFKQRLKKYMTAELGHDRPIRIFTCQYPLTPNQFIKILENYGINEVPLHKKEFMKVIVAIQGYPKPIKDANLTIRNWLNRALGVASCEELTILNKVVHVENMEELQQKAEGLKANRNVEE